MPGAELLQPMARAGVNSTRSRRQTRAAGGTLSSPLTRTCRGMALSRSAAVTPYFPPQAATRGGGTSHRPAPNGAAPSCRRPPQRVWTPGGAVSMRGSCHPPLTRTAAASSFIARTLPRLATQRAAQATALASLSGHRRPQVTASGSVCLVTQCMGVATLPAAAATTDSQAGNCSPPVTASALLGRNPRLLLPLARDLGCLYSTKAACRGGRAVT